MRVQVSLQFEPQLFISFPLLSFAVVN